MKARFVLRSEEEIVSIEKSVDKKSRRGGSAADATAADASPLVKPQTPGPEDEQTQCGTPAGDRKSGGKSKPPLPRFIARGHGTHRRLIRVVSRGQREEAAGKWGKLREMVVVARVVDQLECTSEYRVPTLASPGILGKRRGFVARLGQAVAASRSIAAKIVLGSSSKRASGRESTPPASKRTSGRESTRLDENSSLRKTSPVGEADRG